MKHKFRAQTRVRHLTPPERQSLSGANDGLLETARTQWQFGDWASLARIDNQTLSHHPDHAEIALLSAAGHLQQHDLPAARACLQLARSAGCPPGLVHQILIAGVFNTLGRAAAIYGQAAEALRHFKQSVERAPLSGDTQLLGRARAREQLVQLGLAPMAETDTTGLVVESPKNTVRVEQLAAFNLGMGWSGNTVNTVIFRHHGVLTTGVFQYTAFYVDEKIMRVVQRELANDHIVTHDIEGQYRLRDAHSSISLGADREGFIHISYDHHGTRLRYRRSMHPHTIGSWTDELPMTGVNEDRVTYPAFIQPRAGYPLTLLYRDGTATKGNAYLKTYDEIHKIWADHKRPILSGADQKPWTSNAYWNHPAIGSDGSLHLSFVWRTDTLGEQRLVNNINIGYARSLDNGLSWSTSLDQPYKLPITQVNAEVVWPIAPGSNLINQTSMALDSRNRPHIVFYANDAKGVPQYQHVWFDGSKWRQQYFSSRVQAFSLRGGGTLQIPISRPEILIDRQDNIYAVYRGDLSDDRMCVTRLLTPDSTGSTVASYSVAMPLWDESLGFSEPVIDRARWQRDNILTLLLQHNQQPDGDRVHEEQAAPVMLVDYRICTEVVAHRALDKAMDRVEDKSIVVVDVKNLSSISYQNPKGVAVVMPSIDVGKALEAARILVKRAGMPTKIFIVEDTLRRGFIRTLNETVQRLDCRYIAYLAEDAFPGVNWLKLAFDGLEQTGKGLAAFNCGKWNGRIAAFGMARMAWVREIYGQDLLWHEYIAHRADNELTVIARALDQYVFQADALLLEIDPRKIFRKTEKDASNFSEKDARLFKNRFQAGFSGIVQQSELDKYYFEYIRK